MVTSTPLAGARVSDPMWLALANRESQNRLSVELLFHTLAMGYSFLACRPMGVQTDGTPDRLIAIEAVK